MEVLINDILIFDSLLGEVSAQTIYQSNYNPNTTNPPRLRRSFDNPKSAGTQNNTSYYVRPKTEILANESEYYQFDESFEWCKLLPMYYQNFFDGELQDMKKVALYIGISKFKFS